METRTAEAIRQQGNTNCEMELWMLDRIRECVFKVIGTAASREYRLSFHHPIHVKLFECSVAMRLLRIYLDVPELRDGG